MDLRRGRGGAAAAPRPPVFVCDTGARGTGALGAGKLAGRRRTALAEPAAAEAESTGAAALVAVRPARTPARLNEARRDRLDNGWDHGAPGSSPGGSSSPSASAAASSSCREIPGLVRSIAVSARHGYSRSPQEHPPAGFSSREDDGQQNPPPRVAASVRLVALLLDLEGACVACSIRAQEPRLVFLEPLQAPLNALAVLRVVLRADVAEQRRVIAVVDPHPQPATQAVPARRTRLHRRRRSPAGRASGRGGAAGACARRCATRRAPSALFCWYWRTFSACAGVSRAPPVATLIPSSLAIVSTPLIPMPRSRPSRATVVCSVIVSPSGSRR